MRSGRARTPAQRGSGPSLRVNWTTPSRARMCTPTRAPAAVPAPSEAPQHRHALLPRCRAAMLSCWLVVLLLCSSRVSSSRRLGLQRLKGFRGGGTRRRMKTTMRSERARNGGMRKKSPSTENTFAMAHGVCSRGGGAACVARGPEACRCAGAKEGEVGGGETLSIFISLRQRRMRAILRRQASLSMPSRAQNARGSARRVRARDVFPLASAVRNPAKPCNIHDRHSKTKQHPRPKL